MTEENMSFAFTQLQRKKSQKSISLLAQLCGIQGNVGIDQELQIVPGWSDDKILQLNPEKLMIDILDRLQALNEVQWEIKKARAKSGLNDNKKEENALIDIKNKIFVAAVSMTMSKLGQRRWNEDDYDCDIPAMLLAFPDETKLTDGRDCLLTHWAMLAVARPEYGVSEADVNVLVTRDPMSMRKHHIVGVASHLSGQTPAHFLCMQQETDSVMALIRHYAIFNETAFTMCTSYPRNNADETDCESDLHLACCVHCPSVELLQLLIQLDPSQATKKASEYSFTPLALLCHNAIRFRNEETKYNNAVHCLLSVDNSAEYIGDALCGLLCGSCRFNEWSDMDSTASLQNHVLAIIDMLLSANPNAAKYRSADGSSLLHCIASVPSTSHLNCASSSCSGF